jgi:hypothetical protein
MSVFTNYVDECIAAVQGNLPLTIGIGAYYTGMTKEILLKQMNLIRQRKLDGMVFFNAYNLWENSELMAAVIQFYTGSVDNSTDRIVDDRKDLPEFVPDNCYRGFLEVP